MAQIVCIIGNKGGTGKTTLSHMIAHGIGLMGKRAVCVLTDISREKLSKESRTYLPFDARSPDNLNKVIRTISNVPDWFGVVDGGGNRPATDRMLAEPADLVLLPFRDSHEDIRTVMSDLERFPRARALPSQWPTNAHARAAADKAVDSLMGHYRHRILPPVPMFSSSKLLLQSDVPDRLPATLNNVCKQLARNVFSLWGVSETGEPVSVEDVLGALVKDVAEQE
ncbi:ParA family protein [Pigmentiphaga aceris]|uniref:ParA family protein n=1 Tax=Pigmentiphaga aceris TaxID=1940612 RepID=A0A5C0AZY0_9BURK|nr:ParA family protein [Pigmentiphaga aceris]QEI06993.1 ParA family protein [Pigmentiphaga aceris]